jgi:hypothetical protein
MTPEEYASETLVSGQCYRLYSVSTSHRYHHTSPTPSTSPTLPTSPPHRQASARSLFFQLTKLVTVTSFFLLSRRYCPRTLHHSSCSHIIHYLLRTHSSPSLATPPVHRIHQLVHGYWHYPVFCRFRRDFGPTLQAGGRYTCRWRCCRR